MGYIKGVVTKVYVGEPQEPKQEGWAKSAKFGLQIDGKWWNSYTNQDKQSGAFPVKDKDYAIITDGCEVEFMTTTNEKDGKTYENMDKKTLKVTVATSQPAQQPNAPQVAQQPTQQEKVAKTLPDEFEEALIKKFCDGLAALVAAYKFKGREKPEQSQIDRVSDYIKKMF